MFYCYFSLTIVLIFLSFYFLKKDFMMLFTFLAIIFAGATFEELGKIKKERMTNQINEQNELSLKSFNEGKNLYCKNNIVVNKNRGFKYLDQKFINEETGVFSIQENCLYLP